MSNEDGTWEYSGDENVLIRRESIDGRGLWAQLYFAGWGELCTALDARTIAVERLLDRDAYVVSCDPLEGARTIWVDAETGLVLRVLSTGASGSASPYLADLSVESLYLNPAFTPADFALDIRQVPRFTRRLQRPR